MDPWHFATRAELERRIADARGLRARTLATGAAWADAGRAFADALGPIRHAGVALVGRAFARRRVIGRATVGAVAAVAFVGLALAAGPRRAGEATPEVAETRWTATLVVCPSLGGWTAPACERIADGVAHASLGACYQALMAQSVRAAARAPVRDGWGRTRRWEVVEKACLTTTATAVAVAD